MAQVHQKNGILDIKISMSNVIVIVTSVQNKLKRHGGFP